MSVCLYAFSNLLLKIFFFFARLVIDYISFARTCGLSCSNHWGRPPTIYHHHHHHHRHHRHHICFLGHPFLEAQSSIQQGIKQYKTLSNQDFFIKSQEGRGKEEGTRKGKEVPDLILPKLSQPGRISLLYIP